MTTLKLIASLHHQLAEAYEKLAGETDDQPAPRPVSPKKRPAPKRRGKAARAPHRPESQPSELDVARARAAGRRLGILPS